MSVLGWFLALIGLGLSIFGLLQMLKGKKMNAVPFRAPSQIAQLGQGAADAKGLVSTEGAVGQQGLLVAPMSGRPCLAYEVTVERKWEKSERTENGNQTKKGKDKVWSDYKGAVFPIQDGQGQIWVDATTQPDASFEKAHNSDVNVGLLGMIPGTLQFGQLQMNTPTILNLDSRTIGFEGTEKIVPPSATMYALGALNMTPNGPVLATPKGIGTGKLVLSDKGRASLAKSTKRNMIIGYAVGGAMFVGGTLLGIFGPAPEASKTACQSNITDAVTCDGRIYAADGEDFKWTVTTAGEYTVTVKQPAVKFPIDATLTITDATGEQVGYNDGGAPGVDAKVKQHFEPGTYTINVRDFGKSKVKGGYSFHLDIAKAAEEPAASAHVTNANLPAPKATNAATAAPVKATLTIKPGSKGITPAKATATATAPSASATPAKANAAAPSASASPAKK